MKGRVLSVHLSPGYIGRVRRVDHANVGDASMSKVRDCTPLVRILQSQSLQSRLRRPGRFPAGSALS